MFRFTPYCPVTETLFLTLFLTLVSTPILYPFCVNDSKIQLHESEAAFVASSQPWLMADQSQFDALRDQASDIPQAQSSILGQGL